MNKILKSLLSVAIMSASFASCSQVDLISDLEAEKKATTVALQSHSEWPQTTTVVFATNTLGYYNRAFYMNGNAFTVPVGAYKFYVVNRNGAYDYENLDFGKLPADSLYYGDVLISSKTSEFETTDEGVKKVLSGKYVARNCGEIFADSTMLIDVQLGQNVNVTFEKPYKLTTQYKVNGTFTASRDVQNVYVEICDIIGRKKPNGAVAGGRKVRCVLSCGSALKNSTKELEHSLTVLGVPQRGTANIYVRFKGDDKSIAPEQKSVQYTVKDGVIKLGDITF